MRKYGLENFSLAIIEFCTPDLASCLELEQKWIDYYQPKYNILKEARSSIGFRHSKETISKLKDMFSPSYVFYNIYIYKYTYIYIKN